MKRYDDIFTVFDVVAHIFYLVCIDVRHRKLNCNGQIDDDLVVFCRLPYVQNGVADLQSVLRFGSGEAFGGIFKVEIALVLFAVFLTELSARDSDLLDLVLILAENLLALRKTGGVVQMNDSVLAAFQCVESFLDNVLAALSQNLNGDVVGNHILLDKRTAEFIFRLRGSRESDFDFLKADIDQQLEEFQLFAQAHRSDERLISVPEIDAAPGGSFFDIGFFRPFHFRSRSFKELSCVLVYIFHK